MLHVKRLGVVLGVLIALAHSALVLANAQITSYKSVVGGQEETPEALLCMPKGDVPFPVAV